MEMGFKFKAQHGHFFQFIFELWDVYVKWMKMSKKRPEMAQFLHLEKYLIQATLSSWPNGE